MTLFAYLNAYLPPIHFENFMIPAINVDMKNLVSTKDLTVVELWLYLVIRTTIYFYPGTPKNTPPPNCVVKNMEHILLGIFVDKNMFEGILNCFRLCNNRPWN